MNSKFLSTRGVIFITITLIALNLNAQITKVKDTFNDFTLTAFGTGDTIHLYSYLDSGKAVIIDFFEYECGPCYLYHQYHILNQFYNQHGPNGDNTAMVMQICTFSDADSLKLTEENGGNWNWLANIDYPTIILPDDKFYSVFGIHNWGTPAIPRICPDRNFLIDHPLNTSGSAPSENYTLEGLNNWLVNVCGISGDGDNVNQTLMNNITVFPNPVSDVINIKGINGNYNFKLYNLTGTLIINKILISNSSVDVSHLPKGLYFVEVNTFNNNRFSQKIIIKQ